MAKGQLGKTHRANWCDLRLEPNRHRVRTHGPVHVAVDAYVSTFTDLLNHLMAH
jgi:hypothetical protein